MYFIKIICEGWLQSGFGLESSLQNAHHAFAT